MNMSKSMDTQQILITEGVKCKLVAQFTLCMILPSEITSKATQKYQLLAIVNIRIKIGMSVRFSPKRLTISESGNHYLFSHLMYNRVTDVVSVFYRTFYAVL
jgi:hypothetical protein